MQKLLPVGTKVLYNGKECTILAYAQNHSDFLVDKHEDGHNGSSSTWYDENYKVIPYVKGDRDRWWFRLSRLSEFTILSKEEPEFIFNI